MIKNPDKNLGKQTVGLLSPWILDPSFSTKFEKSRKKTI